MSLAGAKLKRETGVVRIGSMRWFDLEIDVKLKCECGNLWTKRLDLSGYAGEVVLYCEKCDEYYFNAQEFFTGDELEESNR